MNMKAAASLTGSLLARKGAAYPASYSAPSTGAAAGSGPNREAYNDPRIIASAPPAPVTAPAVAQAPQMQDGRFVKDFVQAKSAVGAVHSDEAEDAEGLPHVMDKMGRVRLSVRLDPDRYLRVKMASARTRWSAQDIVIAALDRYLGGSANRAAAASNGHDAGENETEDGAEGLN